jgi:hypothetical protein
MRVTEALEYVAVSKIAEKGKNTVSRREISAENAFFALFRPKIRTWTTMPLKVGIIATFRGLLSDPSRAVGFRDNVTPLTRAAVAAGADGIMVEVHPFPERAQSDRAQQLYPDEFIRLMKETKAIAKAIGRAL